MTELWHSGLPIVVALAVLWAVPQIAGRLLRREREWLEMAERQRARRALRRAHKETTTCN